MKDPTGLIMGVEALTAIDLIARAAVCKGTKLREGTSYVISEPVMECCLNEQLLNFLAERRIRQRARSDGIFTLVDERNLDETQGSNYWNFMLAADKKTFDLRIQLAVSFGISRLQRGVLLHPYLSGPAVSASAGSLLSKFSMFQALVESREGAPAVARELAQSDGSIVVSWTDLGFGGIRSLLDLFDEFRKGNNAVFELARENKVFDPAPYPDNQSSVDEFFVTEPDQPQVFRGWSEQLDAYRKSLVL